MRGVPSTGPSLLLAALLLGPLGCSLLRLDPVTDEEVAVVAASDPSLTITFLEPMVWMDYPGSRARRGVRLLAGVYILEAENEDYRYFKAPSPIEMRVLEAGEVVDGRDYEGGLAVAKASITVVPAVAYVSVGEGRKRHVMKMGNDFLRLEGRVWKRSF